MITQVLFATFSMARGKGFILALIVLTIILSNVGTDGTFTTFGEVDGKLRGGNGTVLWAGMSMTRADRFDSGMPRCK